MSRSSAPSGRTKDRSSETSDGLVRYQLIAAMAVTIVSIFGYAYWSEERESAAALEDFGLEQSRLAAALAADLSSYLGGRAAEGPAPVPRTASMAAVESTGSVRALVIPPSSDVAVGMNGMPEHLPALPSAIARGERWLRLSRHDAKELGLSERTALAGLGRAKGADGALWGVAVVASAQRLRDHEIRGTRRLLGTTALTSLVVLAFGGLALRTQRRRLELSHKLEVTAAIRERDERLVRADKLATLGALATGVAHEVSTPLGVILGRAEQLLTRSSLDDRSRRAAEAIVAQTDRIKDVIRGFLNLARGEAPRLSHVAPAQLARAAQELVQHRFDGAGVSLSCEIADSLAEVACEPRLFEQVLVNLLLNACDACSRGGAVELVVRHHQDRVVFLVRDDGHGISPEAVERATEPFFTTKPTGKGTGLGLAIAHEIIKHHCGTLSIEPGRRDLMGEPGRTDLMGEPGRTDGHVPRAPRGTTVSVALPVAVSAPRSSQKSRCDVEP